MTVLIKTRKGIYLLFSTVIAGFQYSADAEKVSLLLKAPLYFDLEMYSNSSKLKKVGVWLAGQNICFMLTVLYVNFSFKFSL